MLGKAMKESIVVDRQTERQKDRETERLKD